MDPGGSRAVLVTGASRGIGRAVAVAFAARGDTVAVHHRDSASAAAEVHAGLPGSGHVVVQGDLADPVQVSGFVDAAADALGGLDVLVNNAAVFAESRIAEVSYADWQVAWRRTLEVNLLGTADVTWCAVQHLRARGGGGPQSAGQTGHPAGATTSGGRIVNISSRGAFRGEPDHPAYGASKAGLNAFGQSMAQALAPLGIAVTTVAPGFVETDMGNVALKTARGPQIRAQSPFNRVATPEEVAAAVVYLASPEAEFTSGAILDLNGASYLRT